MERTVLFFSQENQFFFAFFSKKEKRKRKESKNKEINDKDRERKTSILPVGSEPQRAGLVSSFRAVSFIHA